MYPQEKVLHKRKVGAKMEILSYRIYWTEIPLINWTF